MALENESQIKALKLSVELGEKAQQLFPEIADMYRNGKKQREIALEVLSNSYKFEWLESENVLEHAVKYALAGNDNSDIGPVYNGLISREEYRTIALSNVTKNLCLNDEQKRRKHINGAISRGQVPWREDEKLLALELKNSGLDCSKIAKKLNEEYHHFKIRNRNSVYEMFRRMNGKKNFGKKQEEKCASRESNAGYLVGNEMY